MIYIMLELCSYFGLILFCVNKIIDCKIVKVVYVIKDNLLDIYGDEMLWVYGIEVECVDDEWVL